MSIVRQIAIVLAFCSLVGSCTPKKTGNNLLEGIKIQDLAPINPDGSTGSNVIKAIYLDLHVLEIPAENFNKLGEIRRTMNIKPIKFTNYLAFSANSFSAYYGKNPLLNKVVNLLGIAEAQNVQNMSRGVMLAEDESENIPIRQLPELQIVNYSSKDVEPEAVHVGPGYIAMHIEVKKANSLDDAGVVTIYPLFTLMTTNTIPQYSLLNERRDFEFTSAALQLEMVPGDFILIAPERHISDQTTLSGLFFSNPFGSTFYNFEEGKLPESKPSVRVYLINCVGLNF